MKKRPVLLSICSITSLLVMTSTVSAQDLENGRRAFRSCASCHSVDSERSGFGPYLKGVVGRPAGSLAGYRYSEAMKAAGAGGLVWDEAALAEFLSSPKKKVPGTKMSFGGLWTTSEIDDLIGYLRANP
ncbi:c-type cytochrome [Rhizobium metallidurans]|uniref:Cytochrome c n=1 Tax=Rhizobium metallidurans TaxID=1265931 RepID=A0A7W6G8Q0_9HYPH|nr:cytochrome c family protein [Rhizobium metallidurans]MBB3962753.1 cytochrome c [Rhizobium metallidurans]